jgi:hypothetical protein
LRSTEHREELDNGVRRWWAEPVLIGVLCAAFGLSVHLAGWLLGYRLFEQGRGCDADRGRIGCAFDARSGHSAALM